MCIYILMIHIDNIVYIKTMCKVVSQVMSKAT